MKIFIASNNRHKLIEIESFFNPLGIRCLTPANLKLDLNPEETADTFSGNALLKAKSFFEAINGQYPVLSDDSGLCVEALNGRPGVFSARYRGRKINFIERNTFLLNEVREISNPKAYFVSHLCLYLEKHYIWTVEDFLQGHLGQPTSVQDTQEDLGYDPIFYPQGQRRSLAEFTLEEKNQISARGKALKGIFWILSRLHFQKNK